MATRVTAGTRHSGTTTAQLQFYDRYLKGIRNGWESQPVVQIYVLVPPNSGDTGTGFWITGQDFPLPGTHRTKIYLKSGGRANTRLGDGALVTAVGGGGPGDQFDYNPNNPVPTVGGNMCCNSILIPEGAQDQTAVEMRRDVLVYTGKPLVTDEAVIGTVTANFWAISSAPDTDFTVKLVDVHPDGLTHNVLDRIVRASLRWGSKLPPKLIRPGVVYEYSLEVGNTATMFRAGHQMRVEISSSNFPHYGRNLNTGHSDNKTSPMAVAHQTVLHDSEHPSYIQLPIAPGVQIPTTTASSSQ
jgi:putative CocE/NonD family hydrolase